MNSSAALAASSAMRVESVRLGAPALKLHAFVEALGYAHGALGRVAEALVGHLLQGRGDEGRLRCLLAALLLHPGHGERSAFKRGFEGLGIGLAGDCRLGAADPGQIRPEGGAFGSLKQDAEHPVLLGLELFALEFPVHDEPKRHGLHAAGRDAPLDCLPQQGGNLVAHEAVEDAPRLLGMEEVGVQPARMRQGLLHGVGGDLVELDPLDLLGLALQKLCHVPGYGLPFAVGVGRKVGDVGLGSLALQRADDFLLAGYDVVLRLEAVGLVHAEGAGRQVAHVADAGLHGVGRAKDLAYGLHLGRRLDDDQFFSHELLHWGVPYGKSP